VISRGWKDLDENAWTIHLVPKLDADDGSDSSEQSDDTSDAEHEPEHESENRSRMRLATQQDLDRIYGSDNLLIGSQVKPEPGDEDAS
jgi:hypothetical protein